MTDEQIEGLIRRHRQLVADAAELKGEADEIKRAVDSATEVGWKFTVDGITASKREANRSFDVSVAVTLLDADERAACVVTRYDAELLRAAIKEKNLLETCMAPKPNVEPVVKL